ncbi:copper resistance protein B [Novosphingobium olei]
MNRLFAALTTTSALALTVAAPAQAQSMQNMPGMSMPMPSKKPAAKRPAAKRPTPQRHPTARRTAPARHPPAKAGREPMENMPGIPGMSDGAAQSQMTGMDHRAMPMPGAPAQSGTMEGMDHSAMPGMEMPADQAGHDMSGMSSTEQTGTNLPAGNAPAPLPPMDHYADRQFPAGDMQQSRSSMMRESGGQSFNQVMFNLAEYQAHKGRDGYRWDGEAWFGGDVSRLTLKSEGEGAFREGVESAEIQALYSRAIGPYFNLQAGVRHDFEPGRPTTYAAVGFEGLAPYWFEVEGALFLSDKGDLLARLEGYYDQRITQRLVLQPRVELNLAAQDVPATRTGAGLSSAELGLRLRYEISRQFAPYIGVSYEAKTGQTARYARAEGEDPTRTSLVAGVRFWF